MRFDSTFGWWMQAHRFDELHWKQGVPEQSASPAV